MCLLIGKHFSRRQGNAANGAPASLSAVGSGWQLEPAERSAFHGSGNLKFVSTDRRREAVYTPSGSSVTDPRFLATENYGTNDFTHGVLDVLPWLVFGNAGDTSTFGERWDLLVDAASDGCDQATQQWGICSDDEGDPPKDGGDPNDGD